MTYFQIAKIKSDLGITTTDYDDEINDTWGPAADTDVDNRAGTSLLGIAAKQKAANYYVAFLYYKSIGMLDRAKLELEQFTAVFEEYLLSLSSLQGADLIVVASNYKSHPLNPDITPYSSIRHGGNSTDDSDIE